MHARWPRKSLSRHADQRGRSHIVTPPAMLLFTAYPKVMPCLGSARSSDPLRRVWPNGLGPIKRSSWPADTSAGRLRSWPRRTTSSLSIAMTSGCGKRGLAAVARRGERPGTRGPPAPRAVEGDVRVEARSQRLSASPRSPCSPRRVSGTSPNSAPRVGQHLAAAMHITPPVPDPPRPAYPSPHGRAREGTSLRREAIHPALLPFRLRTAKEAISHG